jgi:hypothetical protein
MFQSEARPCSPGSCQTSRHDKLLGLRRRRRRSVSAASAALPLSRTTRRLDGRFVTARDFCSGTADGESSSQDLVATWATKQNCAKFCVRWLLGVRFERLHRRI